MSSGEVVGLMLTTVLLGFFVGLVLGTKMAERRERRVELLDRRRDAYARWLAAWKGLSRESSSFVAAFRALGAEQRDSDYYSLRCEEAQRARTAWCAAMRELECAEATLLVWSDRPALCEELAAFERVTPEMLRTAINGRPQEVSDLVQRLHDTAERASRFALTATTPNRDRNAAPAWLRAVLSILRRPGNGGEENPYTPWRSALRRSATRPGPDRLRRRERPR